MGVWDGGVEIKKKGRLGCHNKKVLAVLPTLGEEVCDSRRQHPPLSVSDLFVDLFVDFFELRCKNIDQNKQLCIVSIRFYWGLDLPRYKVNGKTFLLALLQIAARARGRICRLVILHFVRCLRQL